MAFYIGTSTAKIIINNDGIFEIGTYGTRADLPLSGVQGYMAWLTDQQELVINTGNTVHPSPNNTQPTPVVSSVSPDEGVTWYKIVNPSGASTQSGRLDQGTLLGGYNTQVNWNAIHRLDFSTDSAMLRPETTPWATRYSTAMSSKLFAYYHAGYTGPTPGPDSPSNRRTCRQSWTTFAISEIASARPSTMGDGFQVTLYSTSNLNNNYGLIQYGGECNYFIFATDTTTTTDEWYANGAGPYSGVDLRDPNGGASNNYGLSANGPNFGYVNHRNVAKFNWNSKAYILTGQTSPRTGGGFARGGHSTPYNKFYYGDNVNIDSYNTTLDQWNSSTLQFPLFTDDSRFSDAGGARSILFEGSAIPGQDWGYWYSMWGYNTTTGGTIYAYPAQYTSFGPYTSLSQKTFYATDTTIWSPSSDLGSRTSSWAGGPISGNSASGCSGPTS